MFKFSSIGVRILAPVVALAALAGAPASAQNAASAAAMARLEPAFSNTLRIIYGDGRVANMWLDRDGAYRGHGRRQSSGVWRVRDNQLCFSQRRPIPVPVPYCTPLVQADVGSRWAARSLTGEPVTIEVVRGR